MKRTKRTLGFVLVLAIVFAAGTLVVNKAWAEEGVSATEIILGQSAAFDGPAKALGAGMKTGMQAYFEKINNAGGINGKKIRLISYSDGYEPDRCIKNTQKLISEDKVFALIGFVGTPTAKVVVPIAEKNKVPFVAPFTGAEFLRNPFKNYVVNLRGSYYQETEALVKHFVDQKGMKKISVFYQNDGYGRAGLSGVEIAMKKRNMQLASTGTYERNTLAVKSGLVSIKKGQPEAVILVGAYAPCAEFIKLAKKIGMKKTIFANISFVGTKALFGALAGAHDNNIVSQVVPYPWDMSIPLVAEYHQTMNGAGKKEEIGFVSLEGYMAAKLFCQTLSKMHGNITRKAFLETVGRVGDFDLGGIVLRFGPSDHQGMDKVFKVNFDGGKINPAQ
ncbi:MAG: ABC transporter substrate-binding protein [Spirochaetales bacterium]|jgi:branched-chain amino acid transport system substrate-binding protein|nr:ABC transporter substrate-binding protein [Spirochaetales bacterium]